ncbi:cysteine-rich CWC family protein [Craterilacuibacter sinensis]|uniref:DUF1289 domain-containing protein n=1 Tax=Craterilacuibacter sinensis TaxID=2686017 RepID=A0A845BPH0_9NEIS|nr:cysteine-rich CWC family protein [Craterilacuibacter sinensis]MXR36166.1 DUF1289 domain-containing protein [Craterilacuibacter sinensis]RQW25492.1 DUF1289 domain-containing protein [Rhodobacteraceae bacterium CH30]
MSVVSPCIGQCKLDESGRYCTGCQRTRDEIGAWSAMSDAGKKAVWARLLSLKPAVRQKVCEACGAGFACGSGAKDGTCWCNDLPNVLPPTPGVADCLCPDCLKQKLAAEYQARGLDCPL